MNELLVVVDMQNDFIDGVLGTPEARAIVPKVCGKLKEWGGDFLLTRDTHGSDYLDTAEGKMLPVPHCIEGSEGWQLNKELLKVYDSIKKPPMVVKDGIIDKHSFGDPFVAAIACVLNYDRVVLCGLCTDICVISMALLIRSHAPEVEIVVDASCCAGVTPESHKTALAAMKPCNIRVINE